MQTQELSTTGILSLFQTSKEQRQSFVNNIIEAINNGEVIPLNVHLQVKSMEDIIKQLNDNKQYKECLLDSFKNHAGGQKNFEYYHAKFEVKEVGTKYDYSNCNDPMLVELQKAADAANEALKERQNFLKTLPVKGLEILHEDELLTIYPPSKSSTTSVAVTLK